MWEQQWTDWSGHCSDICRTADGGYVVIASVSSETDSTDDALIFKLLPQGTSAATPPSIPGRFALHQNYPNPFNAATRIDFELPRAGRARLDIFDLSGRKVRTIAEGILSAGVHTFLFDGADLPSGTYVYRLTSGPANLSRRMVLLK